jgi:phosphatidylserine decarboxylase
MPSGLSRLSWPEKLNFLLCNRIPRRSLSLFMGWFSKIENPLISQLSLATWQLFADDLRLHEAKKSRFSSLHDCFTRELRPGVRPLVADPEVLVSPCDGIIGEFGDIKGREVLQAKGFPYLLSELLGDADDAECYQGGRFITLRLKPSMYHRFHAPCAARVSEVVYISGDTWNVNPIALKVIERLFCRNERAVVKLTAVSTQEPIALVAVAAVLVASLHLHGLTEGLHLRYRGPNRIPCTLTFAKGDEIGYFEHGSTIIMLTSRRYEFDPAVQSGRIIRMGEAILRPKAVMNQFSHSS